MTQQAKNLISLCMRGSETSIRQALQMTSAAVRNEIVDHYGGDLSTAVTHLHLGTK